MLFRNLFIVFICALSLCFPILAQADHDPDSAASPSARKGSGMLKLCVVENNPPFSYWNEDQELVGFNVDLWNAMNIPYAFTYRRTDFPTALAGVEGGYCHMVLTNISITPERRSRFNLSEPYLRSSLAIMLRSSEARVNTPGDLQGKSIAVLKGSTSEKFALEKLKAGEVLALISEERLFTALLNSKADAILSDLPVMQRYIANQGRGLVRILETEISPQDYAYGFAKGADNIRDSVNTAIKRLQQDGTIAALYEKWFNAPLLPMAAQGSTQGSVPVIRQNTPSPTSTP